MESQNDLLITDLYNKFSVLENDVTRLEQNIRNIYLDGIKDIKPQLSCPAIEKYDKNIIKELKDLKHFYFVPNQGNLGDMVIAEAEYQVFNFSQIKYDVLDIFNDEIPDSNFHLVYGGGGIFIKHYKDGYMKILEIFQSKSFNKCIILPSSFNECDDVIDTFDERFTVFCREQKSYDDCISKNKKAKFILSDDIALSLDFDMLNDFDSKIVKDKVAKIHTKNLLTLNTREWYRFKEAMQIAKESIELDTLINKNRVRIGYLLRTDIEKNNDILYANTFDISLLAVGSCVDKGLVTPFVNMFKSIIDTFDVVITDRLHVGIMAALLNKEVYLIDNSYGKISGVFEKSLKKFKNVKIVEKPEDVDINKLKTKKSHANLDFINTSYGFMDFLNIYLYNTNYKGIYYETIWKNYKN